MRITGGTWRGRTLAVPKTDAVRPTQDRVREALFSILQGVLPGASFLDLFAGSGAVGLEALSRGAAAAVFVERDPRHVACLEKNVQTLQAAQRVRVVRSEAEDYFAAAHAAEPPQPFLPPFDIVFADPPYELGAEKGYAEVLAVLARRGLVKVGGLFVAEMKRAQDPDLSPLWELVRDRTYGQTRIAVYRRLEEAGGTSA